MDSGIKESTSIMNSYTGIVSFLLGVIFIISSAISPAWGNDTLIVPCEKHPTINAAVEAANEGDLILVKPGRYYENILINLKSLSIKSTNGPRETVIDGNSNGSVVTFKGVGDKKFTLEGFTIINGTGTKQMMGHLVGGGLYLKKGIVKICGNMIVGNSAFIGAGVHVTSSGMIRDNTIALNVGKITGAGLFAEKTEIGLYNNYVLGNFIGHSAGGFGIISSNEKVQVRDNLFVENWGFYGGGLNAFHSSPTVIENIFYCNRGCRGGGILVRNKGSTPLIQGNIVTKSWGCFGGGICCIYGATPVINGNYIYENTTFNPYCIDAPNSKPELDDPNDENLPDFSGGGIYCTGGSDATILNNIIFDNIARLRGGGIGILNSSPVVGNNSLTRNRSVWGAGGLYFDEKSTPRIYNNIIWNNYGDEVTCARNISCCDVEGGCEGEGNKDVDPLFVDVNDNLLHLSVKSPLLGAGCTDETHRHYPDIDGDLSHDQREIGADEVAPYLVLKVAEGQNNPEFYIQNWEAESGPCVVLGVMSLHEKPWPAPSVSQAAAYQGRVMEWTKELPRWQKTEQRDGRKSVPPDTLLAYIHGEDRTPTTEIPLPLQIRRSRHDPYLPAFLVFACMPELDKAIVLPRSPVFMGLGLVCMLNKRHDRFKVQ